MNKIYLLIIILGSSLFVTANTITVSNVNDAGPGSLRQSIIDASSGDTINFSITGVIILSSVLDIDKSLTILGPGADILAIDGNNTVPIFDNWNYPVVTDVEINGLELRNGYGYYPVIDSDGNLTMSYCYIHSNASISAQCILRSYSNSLSVENTTMSNNTGAIEASESDVNIKNSTFIDNNGLSAIRSYGSDISLTNVTISGTLTWASLILQAYEDWSDPILPIIINSTLSISNCIFDNVANDYYEQGCISTSLGYNISSDNSMSTFLTATGDLLSTSSNLDPAGLQNNGGTVPTVSLLCNSPAIDAGLTTLLFDQRGYPRSGASDIGAFEYVPLSGTDNQIACNSHIWLDGITYTSSNNSATWLLSNVNGCDSIITLNLTINNNYLQNTNAIYCKEYTVPSGNATYYSSGIYNDTLITVNGCDSVLVIDLTILQVDNSVTQNGIELTSNAIGAQYNWFNCATGVNVLGATDQTFIPTENGTYAVVVLQNNCYDTSSCYTINSVGLPNVAFDKLEIYPNPNNGFFKIKGVGLAGKEMEILDLNGRLIMSLDFIEDNTLVNISNFHKGVYILKIEEYTIRIVLD